jgi:hypothetical protein
LSCPVMGSRFRGSSPLSPERYASLRFVHSTGLFSQYMKMDTNPMSILMAPRWTRRAKRPDRREEVPLGCDSRSKRARRTEKNLCPHLSGHRSRQTIIQSSNPPIPPISAHYPITRSRAYLSLSFLLPTPEPK